MKHITFTNDRSEHLVSDMGQLIERLEKVTDLRDAKGKRYPLSILLAIILLVHYIKDSCGAEPMHNPP